MKKYRLIKKYPGSPKLGSILTLAKEGDYAYGKNNLNVFRHKNEIENHPEFWEKVIEKDYEILSYRNSSNGGLRTIGQRFLSNEGYRDFTEKDLYAGNAFSERKLYSIHSVKRLSDGEVFTVGDFVKENITGQCKGWRIKEFSLKDTRCFSCGVNINNIEKVKQPLFTTEDGVDIYEGDKYFELALTFKPQFREAIYECIGRTNIIYTYSTLEGKKEINELGRYYFSTKEAAEEYILMNKPCLSIKEIAPLFGQYYLDNSFSALDKLTTKLKELVKSK